jgi:hypothetical protein
MRNELWLPRESRSRAHPVDLSDLCLAALSENLGHWIHYPCHARLPHPRRRCANHKPLLDTEADLETGDGCMYPPTE